jgi:ABC-type antimicrobial peptide transport system permease subunit
MERAVAIISAFLGSVALILAWAGLYGLLAYTVSRRTAEIGMRIAIGAPHRAVLWLVLKDCLVLSATGVIAGLGAALALGRFAEKVLYRLKPTDPIALGSTCVLMLAMSSFAAWIPARRAIRMDPMIALRHE